MTGIFELGENEGLAIGSALLSSMSYASCVSTLCMVEVAEVGRSAAWLVERADINGFCSSYWVDDYAASYVSSHSLLFTVLFLTADSMMTCW